MNVQDPMYQLLDAAGSPMQWNAHRKSMPSEVFFSRLKRAQLRLTKDHSKPPVTQREVAEQLGVSLSTMKRWIRDDDVPYWASIAIELI